MLYENITYKYICLYTGGRNDSMLLRDGREELELFCYYEIVTLDSEMVQEYEVQEKHADMTCVCVCFTNSDVEWTLSHAI